MSDDNWSRDEQDRPYYEHEAADGAVRFRFTKTGGEIEVRIDVSRSGAWEVIHKSNYGEDFLTSQHHKNNIGSKMADGLPDSLDASSIRQEFEAVCAALDQQIKAGNVPSSPATRRVLGDTTAVTRHSTGDDVLIKVTLEAHYEADPSKRTVTRQLEFDSGDWLSDSIMDVMSAYMSSFNIILDPGDDEWWELRDHWQTMMAEGTKHSESTTDRRISRVLDGLNKLTIVDEGENIHNGIYSALADFEGESKITPQFENRDVLWVRWEAIYDQLDELGIENEYEKNAMGPEFSERGIKIGDSFQTPRRYSPSGKTRSVWPLDPDELNVDMAIEVRSSDDEDDNEREVEL